MYTNAAEAVEGLRHKQTKEILPTKTVARNTKLVYLDDECVGLRYHDTIIARYEREGVRLDTRDRYRPNGWFTVTTWNRIDAFTPARTFQRDGLRYVVLDPATGGWGPSRLYAHGTFVSPNGRCEVPIEQAQSDAITQTKAKLTPKIRRFAKNVIKRWRAFDRPPDCCHRRATEEHYYEHFAANEPVVFPRVTRIADEMRTHPSGNYRYSPDKLADAVERTLVQQLRDRFITLAIARIAPEFPYPQIAPRR